MLSRDTIASEIDNTRLENEDLSVEQAEESSVETSKHSKISYTRKFLLSLSELEICRKLPSGFDESIISEFSCVSDSIQDHSRISDSLSLQGSRYSDYGSSSSTRGDMGNYSRWIPRWDSRSRSDTDSQSDKESDSGRRYGNQSRRSWQNLEHDGLLGSGSFPRPSGYAAGASVPRFRANDQYQPNRINDPYPPRPYKAVPYSRREVNDSYNDETFGSAECTSQDRVEEERKRRVEFEMMRKEQQKALQEKLKFSSDRPVDPLSGFTTLEENPRENKLSNEENDPMTKPALQNDSGKLSASSHAHTYRPLVPPGFTNSNLERNSGAKSLLHPNAVEVGKFDLEVGHQDDKELAQMVGYRKQQSETANQSSDNGRKSADLSSTFEACQANDADDQSLEVSSCLDVSEVIGNGQIIGLDTEKISGKTIVDECSLSTSILGKLFESSATGNSGGIANFVEDQDTKTHDVWSAFGFQSSKFAHWFLEEDKKPLVDNSSEKANDLLSLIVGVDKGGSMVPDVKANHHLPPAESNPGMMMSSLTSAVGIAEQSTKNKPEAMPTVLTCEDLEQSILSEISGNNSNFQPLGEGYYASDVEAEHAKTDIDNRASQHLLSLLQKGIGSKNVAPTSILDKECPVDQHDSEFGNVGATPDIIMDGNAEKSNSSGKTLTLETLFGISFMKELQSVDAPVSAQRNSVGLTRADASDSYGSRPISDDVLYPSSVSGIGLQRISHDRSILASNNRQEINLDKLEGHWSGLDDHRKDVELQRLPTEVNSKLGDFDAPLKVQLPDEDSLIAVGDPVNAQSSMFMPVLDESNMELLSSSSNRSVNMAEKLAALSAAIKDEWSVAGQKGLPFFRGPYDMVNPEFPYQNLQVQSSAQFHPRQTDHGRPLFHPLKSHPAHIDPQLKYIAPEAMIQHDAPTNHQFPANTIHTPYQHPNDVLPEFDHPVHHVMLQQLHMPGNLPSPVPKVFPGGAPMPLHRSNNPAGYVQEQNPMQGFHFGQQQSNFNGVGMPMPGPELGGMSNPPEAIQRLLEMELRSNPKQMHPFGHGGHTRPMYGHELDTGLWYR
ncbi:hypothetical protein Nepgr_002321 [Nepenthes gracilis]|uniref:Uncharacterized protein n=1 Tax=Nepenthes gracilis TaxID=150966 RepID=A0AAD3RWS6_NEPGR|nr:hypothetical protein Nepgr_002321 [Nepenthes gracilis]